jgi:hypothetical protein
MSGSTIEFGGKNKPAKIKNDIRVEERVTYTLLKDSRFFIVENVPAHIDARTGEPFFSPQTVEHLREIILEHKKTCSYH